MENNKQAMDRSLTYYYEHREEVLKKQREYYALNKERIRARQEQQRKKQREEQQKQREADQAKELQEILSSGLKVCSICGQKKPLSAFWKRKTTTDGYDVTCAECRKKRLEELQTRPRTEVQTKVCTSCGIEKPIDEFNYNRNSIDGHLGQCKACIALQCKNYKDNLTPEQKAKRKEYAKEYTEQHKEHIRNYAKQYRENNQDKLHQMEVERHKKNKLARNMSVSIRMSLKGAKGERHWENLVPYTLAQIREHLEKQFTPEMTWDNYGDYWEIDHIIPQNLFNIENPEGLDFQICWSLMNLRPLFWEENRRRPKDGSDVPEDLRDKIMSQFNNKS